MACPNFRPVSTLLHKKPNQVFVACPGGIQQRREPATIMTLYVGTLNFD
jgi:hypothetical protein